MKILIREGVKEDLKLERVNLQKEVFSDATPCDI